MFSNPKKLIPKKAHFIESDISDTKRLTNLFKKKKIDVVIHFAAHTKVSESLQFPEKYFQNNYEKAKIFINECVKQGVKKIIFSSTAAVYGNPKVEKVREDDETNPLNPYASSKLELENMKKKNLEGYNKIKDEALPWGSSNKKIFYYICNFKVFF